MGYNQCAKKDKNKNLLEYINHGENRVFTLFT